MVIRRGLGVWVCCCHWPHGASEAELCVQVCGDWYFVRNEYLI